MITNMASIQASDAEATPVLHTYTPASRVAENVARWVDREHNNGIAIGFSEFTFSVRDPLKNEKTPVFREKVTFVDPIVDITIPTAPVLIASPRATLEFLFPAIMSEQQRKNFVAKFQSMMVLGAATRLGDNIVAMSLPY